MYAISSVRSIPIELRVTWATAWRDASNRRPPVQGKVRYEGVASGIDFSKDMIFTTTDGGTLNQSENLPAGACTTIKKGWIHLPAPRSFNPEEGDSRHIPAHRCCRRVPLQYLDQQARDPGPAGRAIAPSPRKRDGPA